MKTFRNEWILEELLEHPTYVTRRMFGGLAVYLFERQMLVLVEPTKSGRWTWHGVLVCTDHAHHKIQKSGNINPVSIEYGFRHSLRPD